MDTIYSIDDMENGVMNEVFGEQPFRTEFDI
jgi:hypothetical protein